MVGTGVGVLLGVLVKGSEALQNALRVNAIVFNKTGMLARGKPAATNFVIVPPVWSGDDVDDERTR